MQVTGNSRDSQQNKCIPITRDIRHFVYENYVVYSAIFYSQGENSADLRRSCILQSIWTQIYVKTVTGINI